MPKNFPDTWLVALLLCLGVIDYQGKARQSKLYFVETWGEQVALARGIAGWMRCVAQFCQMLQVGTDSPIEL